MEVVLFSTDKLPVKGTDLNSDIGFNPQEGMDPPIFRARGSGAQPRLTEVCEQVSIKLRGVALDRIRKVETLLNTCAEDPFDQAGAKSL